MMMNLSSIIRHKYKLLSVLLFVLSAYVSHKLVFDKYPEGLHVSEKATYYELVGDNREELLSSMREHGPIAPNDGKRYMAVTFWDLKLRYKSSIDSGSYQISSASVILEIDIVLPQRRETSPSDAYAPEWSRFIIALEAHEKLHAELTIRESNKLYQTLLVDRTFSSKKELSDFVKTKSKETISRIKAMHSAYDLETKHGETQGARLRSLDENKSVRISPRPTSPPCEHLALFTVSS